MKHILFLTWKDIEHPRRGGAEVVIYEYAKRLIADGHKVTWFASNFSDAKDSEVIDGINVIRKYSINTIYFFAWNWYRKFKKENQVDIIVDEAGGIPLLSPLYEKNISIYFLIHHIGEHEYDTAFPFPINRVFKRFVYWTFSLYKNIPTVTVSDSTAKELKEKHSFTDVSIVENATDLSPIERIDFDTKRKEIVFLGRITEMKRVHDAIHAFSYLHKQDSEYELNIIGKKQDITYTQSLEALTKELGLSEAIHFRGYTPEMLGKYLPKAQAMLVTSTKEGYGLIVLEANAFGLPVFAYDVAGIRDSVHKGINGMLIEDGNTQLLGKKLAETVLDSGAIQSLSTSSLEHITKFGGWDERYKEFKHIILQS